MDERLDIRNVDKIVFDAFQKMAISNFDAIRSIVLFLAENPNSSYTRLFGVAGKNQDPDEFYRSFSMACRLGLIEDIDGDLFNLDLNYDMIYTLQGNVLQSSESTLAI